jgi:hypothetical protein
MRIPKLISGSLVTWLLTTFAFGAEQMALPQKNLVLDLDAAKGVELADGEHVVAWRSQAPIKAELVFVPQDKGRKEAGSGRPSLRKSAAEIKELPSLVFRQQELVCKDEDFFDGLTKGKGHTWIVVIAVYPQRVGVKDVNSFFGNLRNGGKYEGVWGCVNDDNTVWWGTRNGKTFGRFDQNNPQVLGPLLEQGKFYIIAGRMTAGIDTATLSLHIGSEKAVASKDFPVDPTANPSLLAIGQERDAIEHPGKESFDGEIARFLIWERPLEDAELAKTMQILNKTYLSAAKD